LWSQRWFNRKWKGSFHTKSLSLHERGWNICGMSRVSDEISYCPLPWRVPHGTYCLR
jgi:hypothetical protein